MTIENPSFLDGYLVAADCWSTPVGAVHKDRGAWRLFLFTVAADRQPTEAYPTRKEAGQRLMELAAALDIPAEADGHSY